ncbi:hypothetical protein B0H66DRAFT_538494 [Apodospora peruviana]|uniref:Aminoglycoside phosphotransferase domain-containing protein n=1 Tax=Apodospora peruviana TaxID=516989 RepID=A0AAE0LY95_9PEZI|nr:hypothetical protein B0H66DRAFT_538494 [Apodospora peruviana]
MPLDANNRYYNLRLTVIKRVIPSLHKGSRFQPPKYTITPLRYDPEFPFIYNNFTYRIDLASPYFPVIPWMFYNKLPAGTAPIPAQGLSTVVMRLANPDEEEFWGEGNRWANNLAARQVARRALADAGIGPIVPAVYARFDKEISGTMEEYMPGQNLEQLFWKLSAEDKRGVLEQMARILATLQKAPAPQPVWKVKSLREVLEGVDLKQRAFVHGDFGVVTNTRDRWLLAALNNMLYDSETKRITALLDFDTAMFTNPADEFLNAFHDTGGNLVHSSAAKIHKFLTTGCRLDSEENSGLTERQMETWDPCKEWIAAMDRCDVLRPRDIAGMQAILKVKELEVLLCPVELKQEVMMRGLSEEGKVGRRKVAEDKIIQWFSDHRIPLK